MIDPQDVVAKTLRVLQEYFKALKPEQVEQLIDGRARLELLMPGAVVSYPGPEPTEVRARLSAAPSRERALAYLVSLKLKKADLTALAKQLEIAVTSKDTMPIIRDRIVEGTTGARIDSAAIRGRPW